MDANVTRGNLKNLITDKPAPITVALAQVWLADDNNDDYPPTNFKGSGFWKYKLAKIDKKEPKDESNGPKDDEKPEKKCETKDGFLPWPMCPQGSLPVYGMNGDLITKVKDGPFLK